MKRNKATIENLAEIVSKGFAGMVKEFGKTNKRIGTTAGLVRLTRAEMATSDDLKEIKTTVNSIWKMLDNEARFIQQMRTEYPLLIKRLERIENQLGLPHTVVNQK